VSSHQAEYQTAQGRLAANKFATSSDATQFLYRGPSMGRFVTAVERFGVGNGSITNRSGGTALVAIGTHLADRDWLLGFITGVSGSVFAFTDDTADAQNDTTSDVPLEALATPNTGHLIASVRPFNLIGYLIGTASASAASVVRALSYADAVGGWTAIGTGVWYVGPITGTAIWPTGERAVWFPMPPDFVAMDARHTTDSTLWGRWGVRVVATTAPTTTVASATRVVLGRLYETRVGVAGDGGATFVWEGEQVMEGQDLAFAVSRDTDTTNVTNTAGSEANFQVRVRG